MNKLLCLLKSNLKNIQVQRMKNTHKKLLRRWCSKSCIQFNKLSINFFNNFIIRYWFLVTSREVNVGKSYIIFLFNACIFFHFVQVDCLKLVKIFYSKQIWNLDNIRSSSFQKTLIQLIRCPCTKPCVQFQKLRIKFLINFNIWIRFAVTLRDIKLCKSNIVRPSFNAFIFVHFIQINCLKWF